ncbi:HAD domain-containing protein [Actinomadura gamaensis]|uniref:HAD domain-containing protein n=1 Tax=Actinomadura gamaensis TaxID=1763541 RepID=A0ABV9U9T2_9ACTN
MDVDGPLIPFGAAVPYPTYDGPSTSAHPLLARVDPRHGARLSALPCELVWATTWMDDANELISPRLGLPRLAFVKWPEPSEADEQDERTGLHWKTRHIVAWAAGRAFVWVDDELTDIDRTWVAHHHPAKALLFRVDAKRGLSVADFDVLKQWLDGVRA